MISDEDILNRIQQITKIYQPEYQFIFPLVRSETPEKSLENLLALGSIDPSTLQISDIKISKQQEFGLRFIISKRINEACPLLRVEDEQPFIKSLIFLNKTKNIKISLDSIAGKLPNPLLLLRIKQLKICTIGNPSTYQKQLKLFLKTLQMQNPDENSPYYKRILALTPQEKTKAEMDILLTQQTNQEQLNVSKQLYFDKYISTITPQMLSYMLQIRNEKFYLVADQILAFKPQYNEGKWMIVNPCKYGQQFLRQPFRTSILLRYQKWYQHLPSNFFTKSENSLIFYFDILHIIEQNKYPLYNLQHNYDAANLKKIILQIIGTINDSLLESVLENKNIFYFKNNQLVMLSSQALIRLRKFVFKFLQFPFRSAYIHKTYGKKAQGQYDDLFGYGSPSLDFVSLKMENFPVDKIFSGIRKIFGIFLREEFIITSQHLQSLFQYFRWITSAPDWTINQPQLLSEKPEGQDCIKTLIQRLLDKYLKQPNCSGFLYHTGIWLLGYKQLNKLENYNKLCRFIFDYLVENFTCLKIQQTELEPRILKQCWANSLQHSRSYQQKITLFLSSNPQFAKITSYRWLEELQKIQRQANIRFYHKKHIFSVLISIFLEAQFPPNEQLNERVVQMMISTRSAPAKQNFRNFQDMKKKLNKKLQASVIQILPHYLDKTQKLFQSQTLLHQFQQKRLIYKVNFSDEFQRMLDWVQIIQILLPYSSLQKSQILVRQLMKLIVKIQTFNYEYQRQKEKQYAEMDLKDFPSLKTEQQQRHHGFRFLSFQQHLQNINKYLLNKISLIPAINMMMIELGQIFKLLMEHVEEQGFTLHLLYSIDMIKAVSDTSNNQFHIQFYLHSKDILIRYLLKIFSLLGDKFANLPEDQDYELSLIQFCQKRKQKGLDLLAQLSVYDSKKLYLELRGWLRYIFTNQQWSYSVVVHSSVYEGLNQLKYFEKALICDFIHQLQISYSPDKLKAYNLILDIILNKYHRGGNGQLQFTEKKLEIVPPSNSLKLFFKEEDLKIYYEQIKNFIKIIISHNPDQKIFEQLFQSLIGEVKEDEVKQSISKQLITSSFQQLERELNQAAQNTKAEQIIGISISFIQSYDQPIHTFLNPIFLSNLLNYIDVAVAKGQICENRAVNYSKLLQRILLRFNRNTYHTDDITITYVETVVQLFLKIYKLQKQNKAEDKLKSLIQKLVRMKQNRLNSLIISAYLCLQPNYYQFHQFFCQLAEDELTSVSIELQMKGYFFKMKQMNINEVSLLEFSQTFSRYNDKKRQKFMAVLNKITDKRERMEENQNKWYIKLKQGILYQYSDMQNISFTQFRPSKHLMFLLKSFLSAVGKQDHIQNDCENLSYIAFNYPILIRFIVSYPIKQKETQIPFIDWAFNRILQLNRTHNTYDYLDFFFMEINLIISFENQIVNLSQYFFYRILSRILAQKISNQMLLVIFHFCKFMKFCLLSFVKINQQCSLVERLWDYVKQTRLQNDIKYGKNLLASLILSILYRVNNLKLILYQCQYKNSEDWTQINKYTNRFYIPFQHVVVRNKDLTSNDQISIQVTVPRDKKIYDTIQEQIFNKQSIKSIQIEEVAFKDHAVESLLITEELLKTIDAKVEYKSQLFNNPAQEIQKEYINDHRQANNIYVHYFIEKEITDQVKKMRRRRKDFSFQIFGNLKALQENHTEQQNYQELENELNVNQQSRFAPQQFVRNRIQAPQVQEQNFEKYLLNNFCKISGSAAEVQIPSKGKNQQIELNEEMLQTFYKINSRLRQINKPELAITEIEGNTIEAKWQFLKIKDLQSQFDFKEASLNVQEFEEYCLANVNRLDRLNSDRKNIVKSIEDLTLLKYVQRSFSSDSVDYIIDTIDENYQHFNNLARKASVNIDQMIEPINKIKKKLQYLNITHLPLQTFEDVTQDNLYQLFHSLYYDLSLINHDYLIPFMENPKIQDKMINTLLFIYRNPFGNELFPNKLLKFQAQSTEWKQIKPENEKQESIREGITTYLTNLMIKSFYEMDNCYNRSISKKGIKSIIYEPILNLGISQFYNPAQQIIQISFTNLLNEGNSLSNDDISGFFKILKGITQLAGQNEDKAVQVFKKIHKRYEERTTSENSVSNDQIRQLYLEDKQYQPEINLSKIFQNQSFIQKIRKQFTLVKQRQPFLIALLIDLKVYSKQDLLVYHKMLLQTNELKSSILYFVNKGFTLYTDEQLRQSIWMKQNKIIPQLITTIPYDQTLKQQPFNRLCQHPQIIPPLFKKRLLYRQVKEYKQKFGYNGKDQIVAQRKKGIFQSAFEQLRNIPDGFWYQKFSVKFMGVEGQVQSGYGQGVAKDWYTCVTKGMVNLNYAIFMKSSKNYYFFNRESWINPRHLQFLQFIGKLFAISIIRQQMFLAPRFSILIYKMILGQEILIEDIVKEFDEGEVINNIQKLREYEDDSLFCQTFVYEDKKLISNKNVGNLSRKQISDNDSNGKMYLLQEAIEIKQQGQEQQQETMTERWDQSPVKMIKILKIGETFELVPGGASIPVTIQNRQQFINLTKEKIYEIITKSVAKQFQAFMAGFKRIINPKLIKNFTAEQLRNLAQGSDQIDLKDLKENCRVTNNIKGKQQMQWFWSILQNFSQRDQVCFLQHWTGLPKAPVDGFKGMNMQIIKGQDDKRVFAQTCFNKISIPVVTTKESLEEYMRAAVNLIKLGQSVIEDN